MLLELPNPKYRKLKNTYVHLKDLQINDHYPKPVHVTLGISDYTHTKSTQRPRVGLPGKLIAELTKFRWVVVSPESRVKNMLLSKASLHNYEKL